MLCIALVDLDGDTVGGEVLHGDEHTFGAVDDEVATGVQRVFAFLLEQLVPGGLVFRRGGRGEHAVSSDVLRVKVATLRANHDRHVAHGDTGFGWGRHTVALDGEVDGDGGHVGQLAQTALHRRGGVECAVGFLDRGLTQLDILEANDDVLVVDVEFDVAAFVVVEVLVGTDSDVSDDALHTGEGAFRGGDAVVVGCELVVDQAAFFEKCLNDFLHDVLLLQFPSTMSR